MCSMATATPGTPTSHFSLIRKIHRKRPGNELQMRQPSNTILHGTGPARSISREVRGTLAVLEGRDHFRIENSDRLRPFLLTIPSSAGLWMFISSNGALTAGRRDPDLALFPYYTDDKIHAAAESTGPRTIIFARRSAGNFLWEPFSERGSGRYCIRRNLYKSFAGDRIVFEEMNEDLGLTFRYSWESSGGFGWVRTASLINTGGSKVGIRLLDGVQNILPCGLTSQFQLEKS